MGQEPQKLATVRFFAPDVWGQVDRFGKFYTASFTFDKRTQRAISGVAAHFEKAVTFQRIANDWLPKLNIDRAQLRDQGFTPALHSRELATIFEAAIVEIYSSLDCTAKVVRAVYASRCRGFKGSTRFLFMETDRIIGPLPDRIRMAIASASWVEPLRHMRDELTHLDTGSCSLDDETGKVRYFHSGLTKQEQALKIEDIFAWLQETITMANEFLGTVFHSLNGELSDKPTNQICGVVEGKMLMRMVGYTHDMSFDSGTCIAYQWFDKPDSVRCPFADGCGAYARSMEYIESGIPVPNPS